MRPCSPLRELDLKGEGYKQRNDYGFCIEASSVKKAMYCFPSFVGLRYNLNADGKMHN